jgi:hypothetical protein
MAARDKLPTITAAGSVGQWRQFSGAMQQLQESNGAMTQVVAPKFEPEEFNLAGSLLDVMGDANESYNNIKKVADKNVEEWANGKSFQEVAQEMKENKVPFQYDPFAMASLATIQGRNAFQIGMLEFEERLKSSEFVDKSPEEIDQIFIERQREVLSELGEAHGSIGNSGAFMNGFWSDANKTREYIWKSSEAVKNDYHKQQGLIAAESQINELMDSSVDDLYNGITMISQSGMIGRTPEDQMKLAKSVIESLSKHPTGADKIQLLADKNVPGLQDGVTFRSLFGDETIRASIISAENTRLVANFDEYRAFTDDVNTKVAEGDYIGLLAMQQTYADRAGGNVTKQVEYIDNAIDTYKRLQANNAGKTTALMKERVRQNHNAMYISGVLTGMLDPTKDSIAGTTLYDPNTGESLGSVSHEEVQEAYRTHFLSGNLSPDMIDNMLSDKDGQKMFKDFFGGIEGQVRGDVQSVVNGVQSPADLKEPDGFRQAMSYVQNDPKRVSAILGYDQTDTVSLLGYLMSGIPYQQYVAASAQFAKKPVKDRWDMELPINSGDYTVDNNGYETMFVRRLALSYLAAGKDASTAIEEARADMKKVHQRFVYQSPHKDKGWLWDSDRDPVEAYIPTSFYRQFPGFTPDEVNEHLTEFISKIEGEKGGMDLYFSYDPLSNVVRVFDPLTMDESYEFSKDSIVQFKTRQTITKARSRGDEK